MCVCDVCVGGEGVGWCVCVCVCVCVYLLTNNSCFMLQTYLTIPGKGHLLDGHCQIASIRHAPAFTALDEDECQEIKVR